MADKVTQLYNALKSDGLFKQARSLNDFKAKMAYSGYRSQIYKLARDKGADVGTFSQFTGALGYKSGSPRPQNRGKGAAQAVKPTWAQGNGQTQQVDSGAPMTAAQRALQMLYQPSGGDAEQQQQTQQNQQVDYLSRPQSQMPKYGKAPKGNVSSFVQSLYSQDDAERSGIGQAPYTMPRGKKEDSAFVQNQKRRLERQQQFNRGAATPEGMLNNYTKQRNKPMVDTGSPEANQSIIKTQGQLMDEMNASAQRLVGDETGDDSFINSVLGQEFAEAQKRSRAGSKGNWGLGFGLESDLTDMYYARENTGKEFSHEKMSKDLDRLVKNRVLEWAANPKTIERIKSEASRLGVDPLEYINNSVAPALYSKIAERLPEADLRRYLPRDKFSWMIGGIMEGTLGTIASMGNKTQEQREMAQQANQITREGNNPYYKPNTWENAGRGAVAFASDAPLYSAAGIGATAGTNKVLGTVAQQAMRAANQTLRQRIGEGIVRGVVHGGLTGFQYGMFNGAVQNYSTGEDTSLGGTLKAMLHGGVDEAASFAAMEGMGGIVGSFGRGVGLNGTEKGFWQKANKMGQKITYDTIKTGLEGLGMATGGVASSAVRSAMTGEDFHGYTLEGTLESCASAAIFKFMHAKELLKADPKARFGFRTNIARKMADFFVSDSAKSRPNVFTSEEKYQLYNAGKTAGLTPMENFVKWAKEAKHGNVDLGDGSDVLSYYQLIMKDPTVSWDLKAKFTTLVMGTVPTSRPMMDYITFSTEKLGGNETGYYKYVNEYSAKGELLAKIPFDDLETRNRLVYLRKAVAEEQKLGNAMAVLCGQDKNNYEYQNQFFMNQVSRLQDNNDAQALMDGMGTEGSAVDKDFTRYVLNHGRVNETLDAVASMFGMKSQDLIAAVNKNYLRRTDQEQKACVALRKAFEKTAFPESKPHPEQAGEDGKDVVAENGLGTEQPNGEAVVTELRNLHQAEEEMTQLMKDNDVFSEHFKSLQQQGMTHPQIYGWMIQNGLTEEQLAPYAHYMNQVAKVQGMQNATAKAIEENVGAFVQDWSFHGTMDGKKVDGESALWVQDSDGRTLLVGSGDVAYNPTDGSPREGVGDMLVCLDPNTGETVYVKVEDTTLFQNTSAADLEAYRRQQLQSVNSVPYNQAAQEQAAAEAAKPKTEEKPVENGAQQGAATDAKPMEQHQQNDGAGTVAASKNASEQPQQESEVMTFKDGTPVPVDANGEPDFMNMTPEQGVEVYKQLFPKTYEAEVDNAVKMLEADLKKVQKATPKSKGVMARANEQRQIDEAVSLAEAQLGRAKEIKAALENEKMGANVGVGTNENASVYDKEREQGYRIGEGGVRYDRQKKEDVGGVQGNEIEIAFSPTVKVKGHVKVVEADTVQGSHVNGQPNMMHFGPDWQPKDRSSAASKVEADKMAGNIDPKQITGSDNAFIGSAPSVNERHETIQGNNRVDALKQMYSTHPEQAAKYKQYLMDHAEEFGLKAEDIAKMEKPIIVNELPVDDATAKKLGQMMASGFESGGNRLPDVVATINKLVQTDKMQNLANVLLGDVPSLGDDASLGEIINANSKKALTLLSNNGIIDNTEYENLYRDDVARRTWFNELLKGNLFDGDKRIGKAFEALPVKAKKALLATFMRDMKSGESDRIKTNVQKSILAYQELESQSTAFKNAKNLDEARKAIEIEVLNGSNNAYGDAPIREKYTNFELELAALYKGNKDQKSLTGIFNEFYDKVQGVGNVDLYHQGEASKHLSKDDAIKEVFGTNNDLANDRRRETEPSAASGEGNGTGQPEAQGGNGAERQADKLAEVETVSENNIDDYIAEHYPHHNGVRARTKEEQAAYDAETEAMKNDETLKQMRKDADEAFDNAASSDLVDRIKETDDDWEEKGENGTIYKRTYLLDDKKVVKVDEPNDKGEYTGSYYEYDGKKFGDLKEVADYIDGKAADEKIQILPKEDDGAVDDTDPFGAMVKAADDFKKDHPMTEEEIMDVDGLDDEAKYTAIDYLNGDDDSEIARICYEQAYNRRGAKRTTKSGENIPQSGEKHTTKAEKDTTFTTNNPLETLEKAAADYENEKSQNEAAETSKPKTIAEKKAAAKKLKEESDKKTQELMNQFLAAKNDKKNGGGKLYSLYIPVPSFALKWMDRNLTLTDRQKEILPNLLAAIKNSMYARIKEGIYNLEDVIENVRKDFKGFFDALDKDDANKILAEAAYKGRFTDPETGERIRLVDAAEREKKLSPEHQKNLVGDSKDAEDRKQKEQKFINKIQLAITLNKWKSGIAGLRKVAEDCGLEGIKDTDIQELVETAVVTRARDIASSNAISDEVKFEKIKKLYENQPSLNQRDSERIAKQQYSTPAPYAFLAGMYVKGNGKVINSALEPSAGNGMLTIGLPKDKVHVNDIDEARLMNLHRQGFKEVTSQDGTQPFADKDVDVVVTNPPFGSTPAKDYDGYKISSLEGQMAINALESMKDGGRAAIIIGGKTEYAKNGSLNPKDKAFLGYLYSHYNVEDVINVDGSLYAKQGTSYPTRIILINGRRLDENSFPPVKDKARAETVKDYDELYKRIQDDILDKQVREDEHNSVQRQEAGKGNRPSSAANDSAPRKEGVREQRGGRSVEESSDNAGEHKSDLVDETVLGRKDGANGGSTGEVRTGNNVDQSGRVAQPSSGRPDGGNDGGQSTSGVRGGNESGGVAARQHSERQGLKTEKVRYASKSKAPFSLNAVMPADQASAVQKNLDKLGDVDDFVVKELGYNDKDDLYQYLSSEQIDSVALAINQMKQGNAFIIGDQTGIGKGRQGAALIRYAKKAGGVPIYFTQDAQLLSTVYRDMVDIGCKDMRPFVIASDKTNGKITDQAGNVVYDLPSEAEKKRVFAYIKKNGKLPEEYDYILTSYKQFAQGTTDYENGERKPLKLKKGQSDNTPAKRKGQERRDVIEALMGNGYVLMDECHNASGDSGIGHYFQHLVRKAKGVTFISATYAKRPDNMPIYALRTAMGKAEVEPSELIDAIQRGGTTLQEIMSKTLAESGQMIRRERDMTGVTIDYVPMDDEASVAEQRAKYDSIIDIFNDIIDFQRTFVDSYLDKRNEELSEIQSTITNKKGTKDLGIKNTPFASKTFNTVRQLLLGIKAPQAVKRAIECLEHVDEQSGEKGIKPIIFVENTMEANYNNDFENDVDMDAPDFGTVLKKGLEGVLRYTQTDAKGNDVSGYLKLSDLGDGAEERYNAIMQHISSVNSGMFISPIDYIKHELESRGYRVGELTGRTSEFVFNEDGTVRKQARVAPNKKDIARRFNNGGEDGIDVIIANKSGATGIDLHAGLKFDDQRPRRELILQNQLNIGDEVQAHGRADRTNQKHRGQYEYILSMIPAEQRLFMMLKSKLKSLYANTTSSQKSKFNDMEVADIINKYGDKVVGDYLAENLDIYSRLSDPLGWEAEFGNDLSSIETEKLAAKKATGDAGTGASRVLQRMSLLKVSEQEKVIKDISDLYANEINRINEMGENDLEITELPLKAKTIGKEVWKKGTEPDGDNAFADNTYIEKVNMAILKKPMKAEEVQKAQEGLTGGRAWDEYRDEKKAEVKKFFDEKVAEATQKNEERAVKLATKAKEKYLKDAKRGQKDSGMSDEQIEKMAGYQYENIYNEEKKKLEAVVKNLQVKAEAFDRVLDTFNTEDAYVLPVDMNNPNEVSGFGNSYGRLIDIKLTDNFSPNASTVSFATLDGRRKITFPISGKVGSGEGRSDVISAIDRMTRQASGLGDKHLRVLSMDTANWDKLASNESRKDGYIITGNLMQALIDTKAQGVGGQLVKYTTEDGEVKTGILMPDRFKPNDVAVEAPISSVEEKFHKRLDQGGIENVKSSDGDVEIIQKFGIAKGEFEYQIRVPKSQKRGGKYFMDKELLSMMSGRNFETRGNSMLGEFKEKDLRSVLARLSNLGVKVREERASEEDGSTHFREERGVQYSKTDEKDVKNSRIIPEDVDKSVSSQIEKKFDDEIASVYGGDLTPEERNEVERIANLYRNTPIHDEYSKDENDNKKNHGGLESAIKTWERLATDFENYYGIKRITRTKADWQGDGLNRGTSELRSEGRADGMGRRAGEIPAEEIKRYQGIITYLASAERALEYHNERTRVLEEKYGVKRDEWLSQDTIEKIFKDFNSDKNLQTLFDRIKDQVKNLDVYFGEVYGSEKGLKGFYRHSYNDIRINLDSLSAFGKSKQDLASTILHEMLHPVTSDIIAMYQEGHTDKLTSSQIEAAKEAVDLFNEIKNTFKEKGWEEPYALTNAREFFTELSSPEWRAALKKIKNGDSWWKRAIKSIAKMLGFKTSTNKLDEAEKVLDNLLSNFGKEQFDFAARHANELFKDKQFYKVEDKDELDRLEKDNTFKMYSTLQEVDGQYASPMAGYEGETKKDLKLTNVVEPNKWYGADELDMNTISDEQWRKIDELNKSDKAGDITLIPKKLRYHKGSKNGNGSLQFWLQKTPDSGLWANYNPYNHTSTSMMNDQFTGAYGRSVDGNNLVTVEWDIPESEKTSGYQAEMAHDPEGFRPWHSGVVNSLLPEDRQRGVMLSRHRRMNRVVPMEEVAKNIAEQMKGSGLAIPWNTMPKQLLEEVAKQGVPITTVAAGSVKPKYREAFEQQMAEIKDKYPQARFVDVEMTREAFKQWGKNGGTHFREDGAGVNTDASVVAKHIDDVAKQVGGKVKMVSSVDEITDRAARRAIEEGRNITGWYDEKTGEVHLYMPNIHDRYTAEKTIWHEVVGHKGMRELIGEENYSKFLRGLWYDLDRPENARLKELVNEELRYNPLDFENGIEEGIARLVEDGKGEPGFWNAIKNKVTDLLHEVGYRIAPNTKDVKYLLWLAKNVQKHPDDLVWKMRAEAVRYKLSKDDTPAVKEHEGMFFGDDKIRSLDSMTKAEYQEATDGEIHFRTTPSSATALDRYHESLDKHGYMFTESYMDNMLSLKNLMQAIEPDVKNIADIKSSENPYILQNTMQGAMSNAAQMFERNVMKPLDKAMAGVLDAFEGKKDEDKIKNFNLYMITKHGLERNRILFVRDAMRDMMMDEKQKQNVEQLEKDWWDELEDLKDQLDNELIDLKGYFGKMDDFIRYRVDNSFMADEHDYSGIHAIQGVEKDADPYNDAEAIASVMDSEANMESVKKGSVKDFWDKVKAATQYSLDCDYKNGLMSRDLYGHVSRMFEWYVPLRKYDEQTAEDTYGYITEKGDPKNFIGRTIMRARGRKSLSETNVLAQIGAMGNRAINNGGQNAIKQAFARFIRSHADNNLVTETSVWYVEDPTTKTVTERYPDIPEDATPNEINTIVEDFNREMRDLQSKGLASKVRRRGNIGYRFQKAENRSQHLVDVMIAGKKHTFVINGNPRAAQALNGLLENSAAKGIMKPLGSISRMMAQLCTSYNPEFVMRNIMRDAEFASSNVTAKEGARYGGIWAKYYAQLGLYKGASSIGVKDFAGTTGLGLFAKYRNGTLDMNDKVQRYFKEFMENGGETGWVQIKNMKEWEQQYKQDVKTERSKIQKGGKMVRDFFFGNLENLNEVAENIARFATYCTSRDYGRTVVRSTYDAKEVSTNFNRHGSGDAIKSFKNGEMSTGKAVERWGYRFTSSYLRHCSMFFNAGIQSTNLLVKNLKTNPVGTSVNMLSIPFALGALGALLNNALIASEDEKDRKGVKDPYGELPDYIRRNNLCIYKGGGEFITIPLAIELRAFYGLGDLAAGLTFSPNVSGQKNPLFDAVGSMSQLVPVMDYLGNSSAGKDPIGETIKAISPSAISPFVEWEMNSDWKGSPIERRGDWNENSPAWQRAYNGTPEFLKSVNKKANAMTNDVAEGNEDMLGNGFLDMVTNPSMLNHFFGGIGGGAATFGERLLGAIKNGKETETKDVPFVRSLLYTPSEQTSLQRTKSKWYNYKDELETTIANVDRLKAKNVPIDKRLTNMADYYHFQNSSDAAKVRVIELAEKQMKQWKKMRDRASDTESVNFANQNIDRIMMEAVEELDRME